jgi:hypothetical protein
LYYDAWGWVANKTALLMQLFSEEIDTKVAVLASSWGSCNADDLARTTLKNQDITKADVMARDCNGIGSARGLDN